MLVAGRALQGAFAALLAPTALSMVVITFTEPRERAKAFGVYGAVASSGGALGLLLGGGLTQYLDWRWCLYVNVAIAVGAPDRRPVRAARPTGPGPGPSRDRRRLRRDHHGRARRGRLRLQPGRPARLDLSPRRRPLVGGVLAIGLFLLRQARIPSPLLPLRSSPTGSRAGAYVALAVPRWSGRSGCS